MRLLLGLLGGLVALLGLDVRAAAPRLDQEPELSTRQSPTFYDRISPQRGALMPRLIAVCARRAQPRGTLPNRCICFAGLVRPRESRCPTGRGN